MDHDAQQGTTVLAVSSGAVGTGVGNPDGKSNQFRLIQKEYKDGL